jgi:hypothetical protein
VSEAGEAVEGLLDRVTYQKLTGHSGSGIATEKPNEIITAAYVAPL